MTQASRTVFRRGLILVSLFYICWSVMLTNGVLTSFMIQVSGWQAAEGAVVLGVRNGGNVTHKQGQ